MQTDGEVFNTEEVVQYVHNHAKSTRVFTLGIGSDASPALVQGIAKAGRGQVPYLSAINSWCKVYLRYMSDRQQ